MLLGPGSLDHGRKLSWPGGSPRCSLSPKSDSEQITETLGALWRAVSRVCLCPSSGFRSSDRNVRCRRTFCQKRSGAGGVGPAHDPLRQIVELGQADVARYEGPPPDEPFVVLERDGRFANLQCCAPAGWLLGPHGPARTTTGLGIEPAEVTDQAIRAIGFA